MCGILNKRTFILLEHWKKELEYRLYNCSNNCPRRMTVKGVLRWERTVSVRCSSNAPQTWGTKKGERLRKRHRTNVQCWIHAGTRAMKWIVLFGQGRGLTRACLLPQATTLFENPHIFLRQHHRWPPAWCPSRSALSLSWRGGGERGWTVFGAMTCRHEQVYVAESKSILKYFWFPNTFYIQYTFKYAVG